jgi:iron complex outermembrane receptor protein
MRVNAHLWTWRQTSAAHRTGPKFGIPRKFGESGLLFNGWRKHAHLRGRANGWRGMGAVNGRWRLAERQLFTDFEYQHRVQRSEAGYQLGGTTVPAPVYPSVMLGFQSWSKPNTFDVFNASARVEHTINANWMRTSPVRIATHSLTTM